MVKFKNRVINWQIRCNRQWQKALPWGTMITGIFAFHHNTIIPLKKVSGSLESDTFFGDCFNSIISQPLIISSCAAIGTLMTLSPNPKIDTARGPFLGEVSELISQGAAGDREISETLSQRSLAGAAHRAGVS
ncbi:MAG: hypothetical protein ACFWUL_11290 [Dialister sp.]